MNSKVLPDVLMIVLDTMRADRLSCYGYPQPTSPNLDAFAGDALLFERAISPAQWTIPAHASIFTGEYPSAHLTTQVYDRLPNRYVTLAEHLQGAGYDTIGFCNNPLLGLLENQLTRGFAEFYNYGGVFPDRPPVGETSTRFSSRIFQSFFRALTHYLVRPLQESFTNDSFFLRLTMYPWVTPLWQRYANVKGNTRQSLHDFVGYLQTRRARDGERPLFAFLNLMETHMPYVPPLGFLRRFAPYLHKEKEAQSFIKSYNHEEYRRMVPITEPLNELQHRAIQDWYAAEIAYQDQLMASLFDYLQLPEVRDNTLVIILSDHGDGLDHHDYLGHSFVVYDDLIHVPLIVRYPPDFPSGRRLESFVSVRQIFHTVLACAGIELPDVDVKALSLASALGDGGPDPVFSEAYPILTVLSLMEKWNPQVIDQFRCRAVRRAVIDRGYKLISVDDDVTELFDLTEDPGELENLLPDHDIAEHLRRLLQEFMIEVNGGNGGDGEDLQRQLMRDSRLSERLRRLGYIE